MRSMMTAMLVSFLVLGTLPAQTNVVLTTSANPTVFGQPVTLTATVSPASSSGKVTFYDGTTVLGTRALTSGQASISTLLLSAGSRSLRAFYGGALSSIFTENVVAIPGYGYSAASNYVVTTGAPTSVAVGDFNGDGKADLVVSSSSVNPGTGNVAVLLGRGDGTFQAPASYTAASYPYSVGVADLNGDGRLDMVVANADGNISVFIGNGDGTFQPAVFYGAGPLPEALVIGDFNNDGLPDVAVADFNGNNVTVLLGNGDGTFQAPQASAAGTTPYALAVGDFNGDGKADLVVANAGGHSTSVLLGKGDGTFQAPSTLTGGNNPNAVAVADFNGDGKQDIAVANYNDNNVSIFLGNGDGTFKAPSTYGAIGAAISLAVGDVNGDGKPDLVTTGFLGNSFAVLIGNGDGSFQAPANYTADAGTKAVAVGDFNGDGRADIAVANHGTGDVSVLLGIGATQLKFTTQPGNVNTGVPVQVVVQIQDQNGNAVPLANTPVTITSNPAGVSATINTVNGVGVSSGQLIFNTQGVYTLTASVAGLPTATSSTFSVTSILPAVVIDTPTAGATLTAGFLTVSGWAIDNINAPLSSINNVKVLVDGVVVGTATYGLARQDVCAAYPGRQGCPNVGFSYSACCFLPSGTHTITVTATDNDIVPDSGSASVTVTAFGSIAQKVGVFRNNQAFLEDSNGDGMYEPGLDRFIPGFTGPGGFQAGDVPVVGDWTGDGFAKVGIYRASSGNWFLDANNNGVFDAGDYTYSYGGIAGDMPFVGDWLGVGKSCLGIYRTNNGSFWLLDLNCNGTFENTPTDAFFPFGGLPGDVPVVGKWTGGTTRVGVVRKYAPGGVPIGNPFYWVLDGGAPNAGNQPANHQPAPYAFAFGGLTGDVFVTGDWFGIGVTQGGVYRNGLWVLDAAVPSAPQANHVTGLAFGYGGLPSDIPMVGKW
jgi:hypothetical protein